MENNKNSNNAGGLGLGTILTVVFVILKLCGVINWAWVWVLAPLWISVALAIIFVIIAFVIAKIKERKFWGI